MCLSCLRNQLSYIEEYDKEIEEHLAEITCECCSSFPRFLKHINQGLKVIALYKIKRQEQVCPNVIRYIRRMELRTKEKIKADLAGAMETLAEATEDPETPLCEGSYLDKANQLKALHDFLDELDNADHR
jgi:hypothetical protein